MGLKAAQNRAVRDLSTILTRAKQALLRALGADPAPAVRIITVRASRNEFGQTRFYPDCELAREFAALAGTKTLTPRALRRITGLGYLIYLAPTKPEAGRFL